MFLVKFVCVLSVIAVCYLFVQLLLESDDPGVPTEPDGFKYQGSDDEEDACVGGRCDHGDCGRCGGRTSHADRVPGLRDTLPDELPGDSLQPGGRCGSGGGLPDVSVDTNGDGLSLDELRRNDLSEPDGDYDPGWRDSDWRSSLGSYGA